MSEFDAATAAVQAALDAGARYADARVMHRRYESMSARNGDVEDVAAGRGLRHRRARPGRVGVGLLRRTRPRRRAAARAPAHGPPRSPRPARWSAATPSTLVAERAGDRVVGERVRRSTRSPCRSSDKGDLLVRATATMREHGADLAEGLYQIWDTREVVRLERGPPHRPAHPRVRRRDHGDGDRRRRDAAPLLPGGARPVRHPRLGARRRDSTSRPTPPASPRRPGRCSPRRRARAARRR